MLTFVACRRLVIPACVHCLVCSLLSALSVSLRFFCPGWTAASFDMVSLFHDDDCMNVIPEEGGSFSFKECLDK